MRLDDDTLAREIEADRRGERRLVPCTVVALAAVVVFAVVRTAVGG